MYIVDQNKKRCVHFSSDQELDLMSVFNSNYDRDYMSNQDYMKVGGESQVWVNEKDEYNGCQTFKQNFDFTHKTS
jgi:hypothetical protein